MHQQIDRLLGEHGDTVWRTIFRIVGNDPDARDCYQQTFLDAIQLAPDSVRNWRALLRRIATARAMDTLRQRYRRRQREQELKTDELSEIQHPGDTLQHAELCDRIRQELAQLPQQQAEVFWLRHIEQWESAEIADQLNISPGYVRVLLHRATGQMQHKLRDLASDSFVLGDRHES